MVNKGSSFADFVRFRPHTYARTEKPLPPLWAAIKVFGRSIKEITLARYFIKVTTGSSFTQLRVIRRINGIH